ncbi:MAG: IS110 family transposase [Gemmatimonadetes bacterium]|nr:IS110 family transposase [Gemmatimonadota bacterium]MYJ39008.1 IS110 family transposase [Gemmatimonadota bacterium]
MLDFRDRYSPARAKDDSLDARVLADALRTDLHHFRRIDPVDPVVIELRAWSRIDEDLTRDRTRLSNRVREQLWRYYPQILEAVGNVVEPWVLDLWAKVPTPAKARRIERRTLERLLKRHRIRRITADQLQEILRAPAIAVAPGTTEAAVAHIRSFSERLRLVHRQLADAKREIARLIDVLADSEDSGSGQPGGQRDVGSLLLARSRSDRPRHAARRGAPSAGAPGLQGAAVHVRRCARHKAIRKYKLVVRRMAAHARLRDAVYHWARVAVQRDPVSKAKYAALRGRGHGHGLPCVPSPARGRLRHAPNPDLLPASTPGGGSCGLISSSSVG